MIVVVVPLVVTAIAQLGFGSAAEAPKGRANSASNARLGASLCRGVEMSVDIFIEGFQ